MPIGTQHVVSLQHGTKTHDRLRDFLRSSLDYSETRLGEWHDSIRRRDEQNRLYIRKPSDEGGSSTKPDTDHLGHPKAETILVPYSYATAATSHMYAASVFLSRTPVFQFSGRDGVTQDQEMKVEAIINYQLVAGEWRKQLFHWLYDPFRSNAGVLGIHWEEEKIPMSTIVEIDGEGGKKERVLSTEIKIGYTGNKLRAVRLLDFAWDTKVGLANFQEGEFVSEKIFFSWSKLVELHAIGVISDRNMEVLEMKGNLQFGNDARIPSSGVAESITDTDSSILEEAEFKGLHKQGVTVEDAVYTIIPKAWGLSESPFPEKWQFGLAGREVIIYARPLMAAHNSYPYAVLTSDIDLFELFPTGTAGKADQIERMMTWLFNSHVYNVRKHLNNALIVDPTQIMIKDFYNRKNPGFIRMKGHGMNRDVRNMVHQLQLHDVTRSHLPDMRIAEEIGMKVTGVNDALQGQLDPGGRKTATEVRTASTFSTNRLKTIVEWFSASGFTTLAKQLLMNTQQFMSVDQTVKITGDMVKSSDDLEQFLQITQDSIQGHYDFEPVDGSLPVDRFAQFNLFREMFALIIQNEQMAQQYDLLGLTDYTASLLGIRNLKRFRLQAQVLPQDQIDQGLAQNNITPIGQAAPQSASGTLNLGALGG